MDEENFRMYVNAEFLSNIGLNRECEVLDVLSRRAAKVGEHEGLLGMYCGGTDTATTPSALVNEPACGNLHTLFLHLGIL